MLEEDGICRTATVIVDDVASASRVSADPPGAEDDREGVAVAGPKSVRGGACPGDVCPSGVGVARVCTSLLTAPLEGGFSGMVFILER